MTNRNRLIEVAAKIDAHLRRLQEKKGWFGVSAQASVAKVRVIYCSYQGISILSLEDAESYLQALDGGYEGRHFSVPEIAARKRTATQAKEQAWVTKYDLERRPIQLWEEMTSLKGEVFTLARDLGTDPQGVTPLILQKIQAYDNLVKDREKALAALRAHEGT